MMRRSRLTLVALALFALAAAVYGTSRTLLDQGFKQESLPESRPDAQVARKLYEFPIDGGTPVPALRVRLRDADADERVEGLVCLARDDPFDHPKCVPTDSAGEVIFTALQCPPLYRLWATAPGYQGASFPERLSPPLRGAPRGSESITLTLRRTTTSIAGTVQDASGGPVAGARISVMDHGERQALCLSGDDGRFSCGAPEGASSLALHVIADGYADAFQIFTLPAPHLRLSLFAEASLAGIVTDEAGHPVADAEVLSKASIAEGRPWPQSSTTDAQGRFRLARLRPGQHILVASAAHQSSAAEPFKIYVHPAEQRDDIVLKMQRGRRIRILVSTNEPREDSQCPRVQVVLIPRPGPGIRRAGLAEFGDWFELNGLPDGVYQAHIDCIGGATGYLPKAEEVRIDGDADLRYVLERGGVVRGLVTDEKGDPVARAHVAAEDGGASTRADESGRFVLSGLPQTSVKLAAYEDTRHRRSEPVEVRPGSLEASPELILRVEESPCIKGHLRISNPRGQMTVSTGRHHVRPNANGDFELCGVRHGEKLSLRVSASDGPRAFRIGDSALLRRQAELIVPAPSAADDVVDLSVDDATSRVTGSVRDASGNGVPDVLVVVTLEDSSGPGCTGLGMIMATNTTVTHAQGDFSFDALTEGRYCVAAQAPDGRLGSSYVHVPGSPDALISLRDLPDGD